LKLIVHGFALRLLGDFVHYANAYPQIVASCMSYYEEAFVYGARLLKKAFDEASADERRRSEHTAE
jgi:hypothetical protein